MTKKAFYPKTFLFTISIAFNPEIKKTGANHGPPLQVLAILESLYHSELKAFTLKSSSIIRLRGFGQCLQSMRNQLNLDAI